MTSPNPYGGVLSHGDYPHPSSICGSGFGIFHEINHPGSLRVKPSGLMSGAAGVEMGFLWVKISKDALKMFFCAEEMNLQITRIYMNLPYIY